MSASTADASQREIALPAASATPRQPAAAPTPLTPGLRMLLTLAFALGLFMEVLDSSIANVAVPTIAGNMGANASQGTWVVSSYSLAAAIAVPMTGWVARRFGEVRVFVISLLLFTATSMLCGFATNLHMLVLFRFLQGLVSGPMVPLAQTLLMSIYPPEQRGKAMAAFVMTTVIAPIIGPLLGGYIVDNASWEWIFYINVPFGLLSAFITYSFMRSRESVIIKQPVDVVGFFLLVVGVGCLQFMLDNANDWDWFESKGIIALCLISATALITLVIWELTDDHPIVDLTLFKTRNFRFGVIAMGFAYMAFFALTVLLPLWLQTVMGYNATHAGLATAPIGILILVLAPIIGANAQRMNLRLVGSFGFMVFAGISYWFSHFTLDTTMAQVILPRFLQGIGAVCFFMTINTIMLSGVPSNQMAAAAGLSGFFRALSGSIGTATMVTIWDHRTKIHALQLSEGLTANANAYLDYTQQMRNIGIPGGAQMPIIQNIIQSQSAMAATSEVFFGISIMFTALISFIWLTRPPFNTSPGGGGH